MKRALHLAFIVALSVSLSGCPDSAETVPRLESADGDAQPPLDAGFDVPDLAVADAQADMFQRQPDRGLLPDARLDPDAAPEPNPCEPGLIDVDGLAGCEVGCTIDSPIPIFSDVADVPSVTFSADGQTVFMALSVGADRIVFVWEQSGSLAEIDLRSAGNAHRTIAASSHGATQWLAVALVAGQSLISFEMETGQGPVLRALAGDFPSGISLTPDGVTTYGGFIADIDETQLAMEFIYPATGSINARRTRDVWSVAHRPLYRRVAGVSTLVGVAEDGQRVLSHSFDGKSGSQVIDPPTGELSWTQRADGARVLWSTAGGALGWVDLLADLSFGRPSYASGDYREPTGFNAAGREYAISRNAAGDSVISVFEGDDVFSSPLLAGGWTSHAVATFGDQIAVVLVDGNKEAWLARGTCR